MKRATARLAATKVAALGLLFCTPPLGALDFEASTGLERSLVAVVAGPTGTPPQEVGVDRSIVEVLATDHQTLGWGFSVDAAARAGMNSLPSGDPRLLPETKFEPSASVLEGWLAWEPVAGVVNLGLGKRLLQNSSGFSHKALDWVALDDENEGRTGGQIALFGDDVSGAVFVAPSFALGRVGGTLGSWDWKGQLLQRKGVLRAGAGLDGSWGDHLTLRAEGGGNAGASAPKPEALAGLTWTTDDSATVMLEAVWDATPANSVVFGFLRLARPLEASLEAAAWARAEVDPEDWTGPLSGWTGMELTWKHDSWSLETNWMGGWGPQGTGAGISRLRWKIDAVFKVFGSTEIR